MEFFYIIVLFVEHHDIHESWQTPGLINWLGEEKDDSKTSTLFARFLISLSEHDEL